MNLNLLIFTLREEVVVGACKLGIVFHNLLLDFKCSFLLLFSLILNLHEIIQFLNSKGRSSLLKEGLSPVLLSLVGILGIC